jgi:signal transduction histidine kinase
MVQSEKMSSLGQLVAGVAHEINNPVNFIHANLEHLNQSTQDLLSLVGAYQQHYPQPPKSLQTQVEAIELDFLSTDLPKLLQSMQMGTDRIREIVLSLRNFSRLDEAELKPVDIHQGLESTLLILRHRLKGKPPHPEIQLTRDYGQLPEVECYPGQLNQVFMNLLANAIDAINTRWETEPVVSPGLIQIQTQILNETQIAITIRDNGTGIPESVARRLFDPFFTTKAVGKGTGLGLSISHQIVTERHHGSLDYQSAPGQGTTFIVKIPVHQ